MGLTNSRPPTMPLLSRQTTTGSRLLRTSLVHPPPHQLLARTPSEELSNKAILFHMSERDALSSLIRRTLSPLAKHLESPTQTHTSTTTIELPTRTTSSTHQSPHPRTDTTLLAQSHPRRTCCSSQCKAPPLKTTTSPLVPTQDPRVSI